MTSEEHLAAIYIISSQKRGRTSGLLALCSGPDCAGAEVYVAGLTVGKVLAAANRHIDEFEGEPDARELAAGEGGEG